MNRQAVVLVVVLAVAAFLAFADAGDATPAPGPDPVAPAPEPARRKPGRPKGGKSGKRAPGDSPAPVGAVASPPSTPDDGGTDGK